jgi:hypothetical protein
VINSMAGLTRWQAQGTRRRQILSTGLLAAYLVAAAAGLAWVSTNVLSTVGRERFEWIREYRRNVRQFVLTDDIAAFTAKRAPQEVPYFSPWMLSNWLRQPYIRGILPPLIREPLRLEPVRPPGDWTVRADYVGTAWDSYSARGKAAQGRFESQPISCTATGRIRFEVAGDLGNPGLSLALKDASGHSQAIAPPWLGRQPWNGISVRCPKGRFAVVAVDSSPDGSFAFRDPVEIGPLSAAAERVVRMANPLAIVAGMMAIAAAWMKKRRRIADC